MSPPIESPIAARWNAAVFVCRKCMKRQDRDELRGDLRDVLKAGGRRDVRVIACGCMDLCPRDGVTIALGNELAESPPRLHILDNAQPVAALGAWLLESMPPR